MRKGKTGTNCSRIYRAFKLIQPYRLLLFVILLLKFVLNSYAQDLPQITNPSEFEEKLAIQTDRDLYVAGEKIKFAVLNLSDLALKNCNWSTVVYIEIITPEGVAVLQQKYLYDSLGSSGELKLQDNFVTGNYYIRAYTRWMRNYSQYSYAYKILSLVNPSSQEVLKYDELNDGHILNSSVLAQENSVELKTNKKIYSKREEATVEIAFKSAEAGSYTLAVIPSGTNCFEPIKFKEGNNQFKFNYLPETRGVSISGKLVSAKDSLPLENKQIGLTVFGNQPENFARNTNSIGQFYFSFPNFIGNKNILLNINQNMQESIILVDHDFCKRQISLPKHPFMFTEKHRNMFDELYINLQLADYYKSDKINDTLKRGNTKSSNKHSFYGTPSFTLNLDDYISFPKLDDYFHELIPSVKISEKRKKKYFKVSGTSSDLQIYSPLVMVDHAAFYDIDQVLALSTSNVLRIEIVNSPYVRGDITYGGIIHVITRKGDFGDLKFKSSGRYYSYNFLTIEDKNRTKQDRHSNDKIPDSRNCLLWKNISCKEIINNKYQFITGTTLGEYVVVLKGYTNDGRYVNSTTSFVVE